MGSASHVTADIAIPCTKDRQTDQAKEKVVTIQLQPIKQRNHYAQKAQRLVACTQLGNYLHQPESDRSFYPAYELTDTCTFCQKMKKKIPYKC